jgi:CheY-like chemotaxis protein
VYEIPVEEEPAVSVYEIPVEEEPAVPEYEIPVEEESAVPEYEIPVEDEPAVSEYEIPVEEDQATAEYEIPLEEEPAPPAETPPEASVAKAIGTLADYLSSLEPEDMERLRGDHEFMRQLQRLQGSTGGVMASSSDEVGPSTPAPSEEMPTHLRSSVTTIPVSDDPLACSFAEILHVLVQRFPGRLEAKVEGVGGDLVPGMGERAESIVQQLLEDAFEILLQMFHEDDAPEVAKLEVKLDRHDRRLRLSVRDNGPSLGDSPALEGADPLGLYRGLRRARSTIEELRGLITVEPSDRPGTRFVLSLPLDATRPLVRMIDLGRAKAVLPGLLTEEYLSTEGLLFHRDTDGEHFKLHGQPVPLVDLANYVHGLDPLAEDAPGIAIVGSVEKRIGIYCYGLGPGQESPHFMEAVPGWQTVSGKAVEVEGKRIPLLSVARLLELRMQMPDLEEPGSLQDPMLDAYVPSDDEVTVAILPTELPEQPAYEPVPVGTGLPSGKMTWQALLVNQSEFRRRELARILEERGYQVMVVEDLQAGLDYLDQHLVHLVVTDLRLGDKGAKGLNEFRSQHPELPVVLTSSVAREYAEELARRTGVSACWLEPYHATDLDRILSGRG